MKKEEMRKIVGEELKVLMSSGLSEEQQKLWRYCFNMLRQNDLARSNPVGGEIVSRKCIEELIQTNPEDFLFKGGMLCKKCELPLKESGPYARRKREGSPAYSGPNEVNLWCMNENCEDIYKNIKRFTS